MFLKAGIIAAAMFGGAAFAADLPVIGRDALPADKKPSRALLRECAKEPPVKETNAQFLRRMSLPCPGRLE